MCERGFRGVSDWVWSRPRGVPQWRRAKAWAYCPISNPPQVAECGPAREPPPLEVSPRKRLPAGLDQDPCSSRPAPEGAGASAEQGHSAGGGGWCRHCHTKLVELKRQAWKLVSGPGTPLRVSDPSSGCTSTGKSWNLGVFGAGAEAWSVVGSTWAPMP